MGPLCYALFNTPVGCCALAWDSAGIVAVQLPEVDRDAMRARLQRRFPGSRPTRPSPPARRAIGAIQRLLGGGRDTLAAIPLDFSRFSPFHRRVYEIARSIPAGQTCTYGDLAARAGSPGAARAVGQAMARNPLPLLVPCHRVTGAHGWAGGFSARGGVDTKFRLLRIERQGAKIDAN